MNRNGIISGLLSVLVGCILFILILDIISKPSNVAASLKPIESLEAYFFGFVWVLGNLGWIIGSILLIGFLALFYFIGIWVYKKAVKRSNKKA